jgi:hypothetical protein
VDSLGNFQDAVDLAKKMAGIKGEVRLVYPERKRRSPLWDLLFSNMINSIVKRFDRSCEPLEYRWNGDFSLSN